MALPEDFNKDMTEAMTMIYGNEQVRHIMRVQFAIQIGANNPGLSPAACVARVDELMTECERTTNATPQ